MLTLILQPGYPILCYEAEDYPKTCVAVAAGKASTPTPANREYELTAALTKPGSHDQKVYGPNHIRIGPDSTGLGFHTYPNWKPGYLSHGCVRLSTDDMKWLWWVVTERGETTLKITKRA